MYLETMEQILGSLPKVMVSGDNNNQLMYLPLDKMLKQRSNNQVLDFGTTVVRPDSSAGQSSQSSNSSNSSRSTNRTARGR
jgi:membrane protease subunit HflK